MDYYKSYGGGAYRRGQIESGGGYYYHSYIYENPNMGYYHENIFTETLVGNEIYRHDISTKYNAGYSERLYQNQYVQGIFYPQGYYLNGSHYDISVDGATTQTYVNLRNYAEGWTETTRTYGYGQPYGEQINGYTTYNGPVLGFHGSSYSTYIGSYDGYTGLR